MAKVEGSNPFIRFVEQPAGRAIRARSGGCRSGWRLAAGSVAVEAVARALKRWRSVSMWCDAHGRIDEKTGGVKQAAHYELQGEAALHRCLEVLGMNPASRSKLGLNIARAGAAFDLARHRQEQGDE
jgi:hypothetical protein